MIKTNVYTIPRQRKGFRQNKNGIQQIKRAINSTKHNLKRDITVQILHNILHNHRSGSNLSHEHAFFGSCRVTMRSPACLSPFLDVYAFKQMEKKKKPYSLQLSFCSVCSSWECQLPVLPICTVVWQEWDVHELQRKASNAKLDSLK